MDSFELNKIIGAILGTLLFIMGVGFVAEAIYHPIEGRGPGYELPEPEGATTETAATAEPEPVADIGTLLASASVEDGKAAIRKCQSCHNLEQGGPNGTGPNLWGVVGRPIASHEGFNYSEAMVQHAAEAGTWTYENLNEFLTAPQAVVPKTKMAYSGDKDDQDRANIIAFLSTLSDNPVPFPAPAASADEQATPASEGGEPAAAEAGQSQTPAAAESAVEGAASNSDTPAGAETPAAGGQVPAPGEAPPAEAPAEAAPAEAAPAEAAPAEAAPAESAPAQAPAEAAPAEQSPMMAPAESTPMMAPQVAPQQ